jgi:hypothetical protein
MGVHCRVLFFFSKKIAGNGKLYCFFCNFPFRVAIKKLHLIGKEEYKSEYYIY